MEAQLTEPTFWVYVVNFFTYIWTDINLWAVLVSAVAAMFLGALWYGPLFGKQWMKLMGKMKKNNMTMPLSYFFMFIGALLTALILAIMLGGLGVTTINQALAVTFLLWLGLVMPITLGSVLWEGKSFKLFLLNNSYNLLNIFVMGIILISWVKA